MARQKWIRDFKQKYNMLQRDKGQWDKEIGVKCVWDGMDLSIVNENETSLEYTC